MTSTLTSNVRGIVQIHASDTRTNPSEAAPQTDKRCGADR